VVPGLSGSAARHVLNDQRWFSRYVFLENGSGGSEAQIHRAAGAAPVDDIDGLAFIEGRLRETVGREPEA
jgi:hypothetical protein